LVSGIIEKRGDTRPHRSLTIPGEISLAHRGVLFLDELPEFDQRSLKVLRQPLEDKIVTISRAAGTLTFPANFQLVAAMNPCPCGYYGDPTKECTCALSMVTRNQKRTSEAGLEVSGPPMCVCACLASSTRPVNRSCGRRRGASNCNSLHAPFIAREASRFASRGRLPISRGVMKFPGAPFDSAQGKPGRGDSIPAKKAGVTLQTAKTIHLIGPSGNLHGSDTGIGDIIDNC